MLILNEKVQELPDDEWKEFADPDEIEWEEGGGRRGPTPGQSQWWQK